MAKEFYKILEISENATPEEIKKTYHKLALKYHPDRNKSPEAAKKMQEVNRVYEVLGNEELRKRYDLGETNFTFETSEFSYSHEEELSNIQDELERLKDEEKILARRDVINIVGFEMLITEVYPRNLDPNLWVPYSRWQEKVWKIPIKSSPRGQESIDTSELDKFKETMINAIRKRKEELKVGINNPYVDKTRTNAIEAIERELGEKGLVAENLGEHSNYKEQINSLPKDWQIRSYRDKVVRIIRRQGSWEGIPNKFTPKNDDKQDKQDKIEIDKLKEVINDFSSSEDNQEKWNKEKEKLEKQIQDLKAQNNQTELTKEVNNLKQLIQQLEKEVNQLKEEVQELKKEKDNSSEFQSYLSKKENELQSKQSKLEQLKDFVKVDNSNTQNSEQNNSNNNFPTGLIIGGGVVLGTIGLVSFLVIKNKKKIKIYGK